MSLLDLSQLMSCREHVREHGYEIDIVTFTAKYYPSQEPQKSQAESILSG